MLFCTQETMRRQGLHTIHAQTPIRHTKAQTHVLEQLTFIICVTRHSFV